MTTTQTITRRDAEELLRHTVRLNYASGMIGTPHAGQYTLHEALGELARCEGVFQVETLNGLSILKATSSEGLHRWYVHTNQDMVYATDPWER